jgi:hypothetical protein
VPSRRVPDTGAGLANTNVHSGVIAIGHPLDDGGMANATIIERLD